MSRVVMKKSLAKALLDAGVEEYNEGGAVGEPPGYFLGGVTASVAPIAKPVFSGFAAGLDPYNFSGAGGIAGLKGGFESAFSGLSSDYQASLPNIQQQALVPLIQAEQARQAEVYKQQQSLAQALLSQSQGQGPNPAQAMLNQQTGQNIAGQAALMAGQRGASANPALIARLAAQQGAGIQQQAVGQAATLGAQQQLAAQNALQQQYAQMGGQNLQQQQMLQQAQAAQNQAILAGSLGAQQINAGVAGANAAGNQALLGGLLSGAGSIGAAYAGKAHGGKIHAKANMVPGGAVPGVESAPGDNKKNDTTLGLLSAGEIVIPKSIAEAPNAPELAAQFVHHIKVNGGYGDIIDAKKKMKGFARGGETTKSAAPMTPVKQEEESDTSIDPLKTLLSAPFVAQAPTQAPVEEPGLLSKIASLYTPPDRASRSDAVARTQAPVAPPAPQVAERVSPEELEGEEPVITQQRQTSAPNIYSGAIDAARGVERAETNVAAEEAKIYDDLAREYAEVERKSKVSRFRQQSQKLFEDVRDQKTDPNRYWNSSNKVGAAISIMLGALGQGLMKSDRNMALEVIDKSIERDVEAQKTELGKKNTLYRMNMELLQNKLASELATKAQLSTMAAAKVEQLRTKLRSPEARLKAETTIAELQARTAQYQNQAAEAMVTKLKPEQSSAAGFAARSMTANQQLNDLLSAGKFNPTAIASTDEALLSNRLTERFASAEARQYKQIKDNFISSVLRKESGAAISEAEFAREDQKYFPQPGDTPAVLQQKAISRQQAIESLVLGAGPAAGMISGSDQSVRKNADKNFRKR